MSIWPDEFLSRMRTYLGTDYSKFLESLSVPAPTSIRLNPKKRIIRIDSEEKISWCKEGRYLKERPSFTFDPFFHAGCYYVQEASSMFIESAINQLFPADSNLKVLDLCAAPGGKSTHLLSLISDQSLLVSNELVPKRNGVLRQNLVRWGKPNVIVTQNKAEDFRFLENYFDLILVDAPCSGEGLFRRDPEAADHWSTDSVAHCSVRQREILQSVIHCLKPGGVLIYCTCTFEPEENDQQIAWMKDQFSLSTVNLNILGNEITRTSFGWQCFPHKVKGEGFYFAVLKKESDPTSGVQNRASKKSNRQARFSDLLNYSKQYLSNPQLFRELTKNDHVYAIPSDISEYYDELDNNLFIRQAGIFLGVLKGKELIPAHDLALSIHLRKNLNSISLSLEEAIRYLRCENIHLPQTDANLGWNLASYEGLNLGWLKVMKERSNNYFPKEWRVLKEFRGE